MISKSRISFIRSLHAKKFRDREGLFIAEGVKVVQALFDSDYRVEEVYATPAWEGRSPVEVVSVTERELERISLLDTPNRVLAVARIPEPRPVDKGPAAPLVLVLDRIRDPGNMGSILRVADWFGAGRVFCLPGTVEPFNPKAVQASMGSLFHVECRQDDENVVLAYLAHHGYAIHATALDGEPAGALPADGPVALVLGNEADGVSEALLHAADRRITIPSASTSRADSLNVAAAASILCFLYATGRSPAP